MYTKSIIKLKKCLTPIIWLLFCLTTEIATADSLYNIANRVQSNVLSIATLLILISYVAGVGFALAGILQFKAHKDNPTQVPLSKPMVLICVAAGLLFLPSIMTTAGTTIFGTSGGTSPVNTNVTSISNVSAGSGS